MKNDLEPASAVQQFIEKAKSVGVYNPSQASNLSAAWGLLLEQAKKSGLESDSLTVGEMARGYVKLLDEYGGQNRVTVQSVLTYRGRVKRVVGDFLERNNGDMMAWKTELAKSAGPSKAPKKPKAKDEPIAPEPSLRTEVVAGQQEHALRLPGGGQARLTLPDPITIRQIEAVWKQLAAYRTLLETQAAIEAEDAAAEEQETD